MFLVVTQPIKFPSKNSFNRLIFPVFTVYFLWRTDLSFVWRWYKFWDILRSSMTQNGEKKLRKIQLCSVHTGNELSCEETYKFKKDVTNFEDCMPENNHILVFSSILRPHSYSVPLPSLLNQFITELISLQNPPHHCLQYIYAQIALLSWRETQNFAPKVSSHQLTLSHPLRLYLYYVRHLESKERLRIQPAQLFNFSWWVMWCVQ